MNKTLDIIAPLYNEAANVEELYAQIKDVWDKDLKNLSCRLVLVDDGSDDNTFELANQLHEIDNRVVVLKFSQNFGHHFALTAGIDYANADYCVIMDSDLQDLPSNIPLLFDKISVEKPIVYTIRKTKTGSFFKQFTSSFFWNWIRFASGLDIPKDQAMLRLFDENVLKSLKKYPKTIPFYGGIFAHLGFNYNTIEVEQANRNEGESKYNFKRLLNLFALATLGFGFRLTQYLKLIMILIGFFSAFLLLQSVYSLLLIVPVLVVLSIFYRLCVFYQNLSEPISYEIALILDKSNR